VGREQAAVAELVEDIGELAFDEPLAERAQRVDEFTRRVADRALFVGEFVVEGEVVEHGRSTATRR
jgi:hypothetical protein